MIKYTKEEERVRLSIAVKDACRRSDANCEFSIVERGEWAFMNENLDGFAFTIPVAREGEILAISILVSTYQIQKNGYKWLTNHINAEIRKAKRVRHMP